MRLKPRAAARPFGLRGLTPTPASNRGLPCDRRLDVAQQPIAIAGSKGLPIFRTPKHLVPITYRRPNAAPTTGCPSYSSRGDGCEGGSSSRGSGARRLGISRHERNGHQLEERSLYPIHWILLDRLQRVSPPAPLPMR